MKKIAIVTILAIIINHNSFSQSAMGKNMAKVNLSAFAFKGFHLQYERQVGKRITVALGYGSVPTSGLAFKSYLEKQIDNPNVDINEFKLGTSVFTPEVRYYLGKEGAFHGFYFAPYARIGSYKISGPVKYNSTISGQRIALFDGKFNTISGGLMLGSTWKLGGRMYMDLWIVGASFGGANGNIQATTTLSPTEQQSLKNELEKIEIPLTTIHSEVNSKGATVTTTGNTIGLRGLGINIGVRF